MEAPVVVNPEVVSKSASTKDGIVWPDEVGECAGERDHSQADVTIR
jgi:hypothetical protein